MRSKLILISEKEVRCVRRKPGTEVGISVREAL
jgi:hypothetical protein